LQECARILQLLQDIEKFGNAQGRSIGFKKLGLDLDGNEPL
jgi:hypothetical protein